MPPPTAQSLSRTCRKIICVGRNYAAHAAELSSPLPSAPFFFLKPPSSLLPPSSGPILRPKNIDLHHEIELGIVIGKRMKNLPDYSSAETLRTLFTSQQQKHPEQSPEAFQSWLRGQTEGVVGGYVLALDMTARNVQNAAKDKGLPWTEAKGYDTFCPIGEVLGVDEVGDLLVPDVQALAMALGEGGKSGVPMVEMPVREIGLRLAVNGQVRQSGKLSDMIFPLPRLLADISRVMTLEEGDLVLTGTPAGVGSLKAGDLLQGRIMVGGKDIQKGRIDIGVEDEKEN